MEKKMKKCPYCGEEILAVAKKCKYCKEYLPVEKEELTCPQCGEVCEENQKFCTKCGYSFEGGSAPEMQEPQEELPVETPEVPSETEDSPEETSEDVNTNKASKSKDSDQKLMITIGIIGAIVLILALGISFAVFKSIKAAPKDDDTVSKALKCDHITIQELATKNFKDNNKYYQAMDKTSIASVKLQHIAETHYDKELDKYNCTATVIVTAKDGGFLPSVYEDDNAYYDKVNNDWSEYDTLEKYTKYEVQIKYSSQVVDSKPSVHSKENSDEFSCTTSCGRIPNAKYTYDDTESDDDYGYNYNYNSSSSSHNYNSYGDAEAESKKIQQIYNSSSKSTSSPSKSNNESLKKEAEDDLF